MPLEIGGCSKKAVRLWTVGSASAAIAVATVLSTGHASDHLDGPRTTADPQADIADLFVFTSPENPAHVVFAMTVAPFASASSKFSSQVDYVFRIRRVIAPSPLTLDTPVLDVACKFDDATPQNITCTAPSGLQVMTSVGDHTGGGNPLSPMRVFAGLRSDPAFFDRQGALATMASGHDSFTGQNAFAGANVLAIIVEVDSTTALVQAVDGATGAPSSAGGTPLSMLAVAAETTRKGGVAP
jgi:hypothetical protein